MVRIASFSLIVAALAVTPSALAGPACARRNEGSADCVARCATKWGWPGKAMGTDPWGQVMTTTVTDMGSVVTKACRVRPSSSASASSATVIPSAAGAVQNAGTLAPSVAIPSVSISSSIVEASPSISKESSSLVASVSSSHLSISVEPSVSLSTIKSPFAPPAPTPATTEKPETTVIHTSQAPTHAPATSAAPPPPPPPPETKTTTPIVVTTHPVTQTSPAPPPPTEQSSDSSSDGSTSSSDIEQYLSAHNTVRAQHGAAPLTWSDELASKAQQWANGCVFKHSGGTLGPFGENLAAGTGSSYDIAAAVGSWTAEVSQYDPNNPVPSHFTQVVWKASTQVGCAEQSCNGIFAASFGPAKYFVCEYSPQGNVIGEFSQNVQV